MRAYHPWPGTFTRFRDERGRARRLKVFPDVRVGSGAGAPGEILQADSAGLVVACGENALVLADLQPEGGRRLSAGDLLAGHRLGAGDRLFSLEPDA